MVAMTGRLLYAFYRKGNGHEYDPTERRTATTISSDDARLLLAVKLYEVGKVFFGTRR